jgi:acetate kinase
MHILVLNPGSSSIKFAMYADGWAELRVLYAGELNDIGEASAALKLRDNAGKDVTGAVGEVKAGSMDEAIGVVQRVIALPGLAPPDAVGYRVVHPGAHLHGHQRLTPEVLAQLKEAIVFAPLHDPAALEMIEEMMRRAPGVPRFACFDTVFHETMPEEATVYALPAEVRDEGVRRYGFHGLSCESVVFQMRRASRVPFPRRMVIAHLGSGCSVTACIDGKSVDTTMGLTPTGGVVMGTRPGDLDPGVVLYLLRRPGATVGSVEKLLNHESGLKALGGINDMRELRQSAAAGDQPARLAIRVFCRSVVKAIAGFIALYGADAIVFTGGIGEHDMDSREEIATALSGLGVALDIDLNRDANRLQHKDSGQDQGQRVRKVSSGDSPITVYVVPAEEDMMIARYVARMCQVSLPSEDESS